MVSGVSCDTDTAKSIRDNMEETDMQNYRYLASIMSVMNALESIPEAPKKLPPSVVADWMEENHLDAEDVLESSGEELKFTIENLVRPDHSNVPHLF